MLDWNTSATTTDAKAIFSSILVIHEIHATLVSIRILVQHRIVQSMQFIAGISISLFIVALLINKKDKALSDKYLMSWMLLNAIHLTIQYSSVTGYMDNYPFLYGILAPLPLLHGVFLYFYVASVTDQIPSKPWAIGIHFVPAILFNIYLVLNFFFLSSEDQLKVLENKGAGHEVFMTALVVGVMISGVMYVLWSIFLLRKHRKNILDQFSELEKVNLRWLRFLIYGLGILWGIIIFSQKEEYIFTGVVIFVILMGFFGIQQIDIFKKRDINRSGKVHGTKQFDEKRKYAKSGLNHVTSSKLYEELIQLIEDKAIYKLQGLSIGDLATMLDTHPNYLSQVINERTGKPFYDFINTYRVEALKTLMDDPQSAQFTLLSLAYDCGFNSKSSFNRYFKKVTGYTPSQYQNAQSQV